MLIGMFFTEAPAVDDGMQHNHIQTGKNRCEEEVDPCRRVGVKQSHVYAGSIVAGDGSGKKNQDSQKPTVFFRLPHGFVFMFLMDNIHDVGLSQAAVSCGTGKCDS